MRKIISIALALIISLTMGAQMRKNTQPIRVALLLPFQTEVTKRDKTMDRFLDFYSGALLAVFEKQNDGQKIELYTYDTGKSAAQMARVLAQPDLQQVDWIIGPVYASQVNMMQEWAYAHEVRTLLPFASDIPGMDYNPYVMQFNPSVEIEAQAMASRLATRREDIRCIFVTAPENDIPESVLKLQNALLAQQMECVYTTVNAILNDSLEAAMSDTKENILLMNTERYANMRTVMPQLARAAQGKRLTLITRYSWQDEPIILPQVFSTVFRKLEDIDDVWYDVEFRRFYATERQPGRPCYDLLGYDLMTYVLESLQQIHGTEDEQALNNILCRPFKGLQSDIHFQKVNEEGGYQNHDIHVICRE